jgi:glycosyltransferase involved in cell wall biosynthesis
MTKHSSVFVNARSETASSCGVQRYAAEMRQRLADCVVSVTPGQPLRGIRGHLWEQAVLPRIVGKGLLWSPANTGPLRVTNQVLTLHDIASLDHPEWYKSPFAAWYQWLTPKLLKRVRHVITPSSFSRDRLLELGGVNESKITVIANGVDSHYRKRPASEIRATITALGIPSSYYLLSLGVMEPRKNLPRLLAAWSTCLARLPREVWLVLAGNKAPDNVFSPSQIEAMPQRVHLAGFVADSALPALYSGALALVCVSVYEGFGLPALEAMACGTPVVAADNTSLPEVVGDGGLLVNPFDVEEIAIAIERILRDTEIRQALGARAAHQSQQFSWERTARSTWKLLEKEMAS